MEPKDDAAGEALIRLQNAWRPYGDHYRKISREAEAASRVSNSPAP